MTDPNKQAASKIHLDMAPDGTIVPTLQDANSDSETIDMPQLVSVFGPMPEPHVLKTIALKAHPDGTVMAKLTIEQAQGLGIVAMGYEEILSRLHYGDVMRSIFEIAKDDIVAWTGMKEGEPIDWKKVEAWMRDVVAQRQEKHAAGHGGCVET